MDVLVTIIRFPLGIVAGVVALVFWFSCFVVETALAVIALPVFAVTSKRTEVKTSWLATYPNLAPISNTIKAWGKIAEWVRND